MERRGVRENKSSLMMLDGQSIWWGDEETSQILDYACVAHTISNFRL
jgi:hypothetical protein